jgi:hypothetical protein
VVLMEGSKFKDIAEGNDTTAINKWYSIKI